MKRLLRAFTWIILFLMPHIDYGQAPNLGTAADFVLFTRSGAVTNTGTGYLTTLTGNVGTNSGSSTGFGNVNGVIHDADGISAAASADVLTAYNQLDTTTATFHPSASLGGDTLSPGVYSIATAATLTGNLVLDAMGDPNAVFIFQIGGAFSVATNAKVKIINGGIACNVFWKTEGMVSVASGATLRGTIIAHNAAINFGVNDTLEGRAFSTTGAITTTSMHGYTPIGCGSAVLTGPGAPTFAATKVYGIFSATGNVTNTGSDTHVAGDVGTNSGVTTGYNPLYVNGIIHVVPDASTAAAASDLATIYTTLNSLAYDIELLFPAQVGHNLTLTPHTYLLNSAATLTDTLYLDAQGNPDAVFVMQVNGAFTTGTNSVVKLLNGARAKNVFWVTEGAVTIGNNATFEGSVVANNAAIAIASGAMFFGRAFTTNGAITTSGDSITADVFPSAGPITGASFVCVGTSTTLTGNDTGGIWTARNTHATVTPTTGVVTGITAGTDTIQYTVVTRFGTDTATKIITVIAQPVAGPITGPGSVCVGASITLTGNDTGGVWSRSNSNALISSIGEVTGVTQGLDTMTYVVTNACGADTASRTITINAAPDAGTIVGASTVCTGNVTILTDTATGGVWSATNLHALVVAGAVTGLTTGVDTIRYIVTNTCGADTATKVITINLAPDAGTISGPSSLCIASVATYTETVTGGVWSATNTHAAVVAGVVTGISAGLDTLMYIVTSTCGSDTAFKVITVTTTPDAGTISGPSSVCAGDAITLTESVTGGTWRATNAHATVSSTGTVNGITNGVDTIQYIVTAACGTDTASKVITVGGSASAGTITGPSAVCPGSVIFMTDTTTGGTYSVTNSHATISGTGTVTGITPGLDTVRYIVTNGCGTDTATKVITVNPSSSPGYITGPSNVCVGSTITLTEIVTTGAWSASNNHATITSGGVVTGVSAGLDTIRYIVNNSCGTDTVTHIVRVNSTRNAGAILGFSSVCPGSVIFLTDTISGGTYSASNSHATVSPTGTVTGITPGLDTISYIVDNGCGIDTATKVITVNPSSSPGYITGPSNVCASSTITLTEIVTTGAWSATNGNATITSGGVVTGVTAGVDTIRYIVSNSCGTDTVTKIITVDTSGNAGTISGPATVCTGASVTLTSSVSGGTWSATNSHASITSAGVVTGATTGTDTIKYIVNTACGTDTALYTITVNAIPSAGAIFGGSAVCVGSSITLTESTTGGTWTSSNTNASVSGAGVVTGVSSGLVTIMYIVTNVCGNDTARKVVTVDTAITAQAITGPSSVCSGSSITASNSVAGGVWSVTNTNATIGSATGVITGVTAGLDTVIYTVTNSCGTVSSRRTITINPLPFAGTITGASAVCVGASTTLSNTTTGGTWSASNATATVSSTGSVTGVTPGVDTIIYSVTNSCGTATATRAIVINAAPDAGTITGPASVCVGQTIVLSNTATGGTWSATNTNAAIGSTGVVSGLSAGIDTIYYTATTACGVAVSSMVITVNALPLLTSTATPAAICDGTVFHYAPSADSGFATIKWLRPVVIGLSNNIDSGNGTINETLNNITNNSQTAYYNIMVTANGCTTDTIVSVVVNPTPRLSSSLIDTFCSGSAVTYAPTSFTAGTTYTWRRPYVGGIAPDSSNGAGNVNEVLTAVAGGTTIYIFTGTANGCSFSQNVSVVINPLPVTPIITTKSPGTLCSGTKYQNFGTSFAPPTGMSYRWSATNATVWATSNNGMNAIVNFPNSGVANIMLTLIGGVSTSACSSVASYTVNVSSTATEDPTVTYFESHFVCSRNDEDFYQWGYDAAGTLDSNLLSGEINQSYLNTAPDFANKFYWVMTGRNGCVQKTYYRVPTAVQNVSAEVLAMNLYPNPSDNVINVALENASRGNIRFEIVNMAGQRLNTIDATGTTTPINVADLPAGIYMLACYQDGIKVAVTRFTKN